MAKTVVVGIDGSNESKDALRWAADYVSVLGGLLHAVTVWSQPVQLGYRLPYPDDELKRRAQESLDEAISPIRTEYPKLDLRTHLLRGNVEDEFVRLSEQADLLVLGNKGHGTLTGVFVGSVALKLVHHARCPVTVVR
ncbi:universal stress protein [Saccharopolyspora sp. HNM0983]|uniref:Universal stress protein n=1 Tax=Saccharopolyspora montiporae TaxID=2781240 RepID=A0A929FZ01_9PSEU|nr:universal stress protein [Saccharopolyspora sp. HNM0983]MBE9373237.1 universal stress protein [Saccharopolyspora sp. HNM0983]